MPKITKVQQLENLLRVCQDGCHKLRLECDAAERQMREAIVRADMPRPESEELKNAKDAWDFWKNKANEKIDQIANHKCPAPSRKWYEKWWWGVNLASVFIYLWVTWLYMKYPNPKETVRYEIPQKMLEAYSGIQSNLYICQAHDKAATESLNICHKEWKILNQKTHEFKQ